MIDEGYTTDEALEQQERQEEYQDSLEAGAADYPVPKKQDSLFTLFRDVIRKEDSSKISNLDPRTELGRLEISVRAMKKIQLIAEALAPEVADGIKSDEQIVAEFFGQESEKIALSLALSKNGFLDELFVSTKKTTTRKSGPIEMPTQLPQPKTRYGRQ